METKKRVDNRVFVTNYTGKLLNQDPNQAMEFENYGCRTTNDFVDWESLHGPVVTYNLNDEVEKW